MRRADQHGPALGPQPARHSRRRHSALRPLAAADRSRPARGQGGRRAVAAVPCGHWQRLTVLGARGISGMLATMSIEAATSGAVFLAYLDQVLLPELRRTQPGAGLVLDNLRAHK